MENDKIKTENKKRILLTDYDNFENFKTHKLNDVKDILINKKPRIKRECFIETKSNNNNYYNISSINENSNNNKCGILNYKIYYNIIGDNTMLMSKELYEEYSNFSVINNYDITIELLVPIEIYLSDIDCKLVNNEDEIIINRKLTPVNKSYSFYESTYKLLRLDILTENWSNKFTLDVKMIIENINFVINLVHNDFLSFNNN